MAKGVEQKDEELQRLGVKAYLAEMEK